MKKLIWMVIIAVGLAALPFGGSAYAGQAHHRQNHKIAAHAGKAGKHVGHKHHGKHAGKHHKHQ